MKSAKPLSLPVPTPTESQERFIIRAHQALMHVPGASDPELRNEVVWNLWRKSRGLTEEESIAAAKFPADRFVKKENVCVFTEHEAAGVRNDLIEMVRIIRGCNHRIADFDGFSPISDGHTPDPGNPFGQQPDILGYTGPYRLGMIGRKQLRWAIFADEWHMRETAARLSELPRRSPELWRFKSDPNRVHFDPIAALGSQTPRIPLPFKFSRQVEEGVTVEKYSFDAAAMCSPGGSNTHVKAFSKENYSMALSNEDISQLLAALMQTPQFAFLDQQMKASQTAGAAGQGGIPGTADDADPNDLAALGALAGGGSPPPPAVPDKNAAGVKYSQGHGSEAVVEKYQALQASHNRLMQDFGQAQAQVQGLLRRTVDADRTTALMGLRAKHGEIVDLEDEMSKTLYSRGANLNDEAFAAHVATVDKYAQRALQQARLHAPDLPFGEGADRGSRSADVEKYQSALSSEAVKVHTRAVNTGKFMTYEEAVAEAKKTIGEGPAR
jgi:hypothetical protein